MFQHARQGFTRLETALGLCLAAGALVVALPLVWRGINQDRPQRAVLTAQRVANAVLDYHRETGRWPAVDDTKALDLARLTEAPGRRVAGAAAGDVPLTGSLSAAGNRASQPWLAEVPVDPWGRAYRARLTRDADGSPAVAIVSAGPDGVFQTAPGAAGHGFGGDDIGFLLIDQTDGGSRP